MLIGYTYKGMFGLVDARVELKWTPPPIPELIVSSHSIIRFAERYFMFNTELERSKCAVKWGYKRDFKVTDAILDKWLKSNWLGMAIAFGFSLIQWATAAKHSLSMA